MSHSTFSDREFNLFAFILNVSPSKFCFGCECAASVRSTLSENTLLSEEASAGGNIPTPWRQILLFF